MYVSVFFMQTLHWVVNGVSFVDSVKIGFSIWSEGSESERESRRENCSMSIDSPGRGDS